MLKNPVLSREFLTSLRTVRALFLGVTFLVILAAMVMLLWPTGGVYSVAAQNSHRIFIILSMSFLALVVLCAPSFTAVSITTEKEQQTYDMLYDTLLRPDEIVLGKFVAGVGFVIILIVASLPMMGACLVLGGVSELDVVKVYCVVFASAIFCGLLGLFCSTVFRSSYRSLIICYVFILIISGAVWVPSVVLGGWAQNVHAIHLLRSISPFAAMFSVVNPDLFAAEHPIAPGAFGDFADSMWGFIIFSSVGSITLLGVTLRIVAKPPQPKRHGDQEIIEDRMELIKRHVKFPFYLLDPRKRKRMMGCILNIIAVKEMRSKAFGRAIWVIRSLYGCFTLSLFLAFLPLTQLHVIGIDTVVFTCISLPLAIIILISPVLTATAISEERESGVFDMLRCTRVGAWTLVMGKLQVAWFITAMLLASTFPTFFVLAYISSSPQDMEKINRGVEHIRPFNFRFAEGWEALNEVNTDFVLDMGSAFAVVGMAMLFATVAGVMASAFCRRSSSATAVGYAMVLLASVGTLVPHFISEDLPQWLVSFSLTLNPFAAAAKAVSDSAFPSYSAHMWIDHITYVAAATGVLLLITMVRVWSLMRPQR